MSTTSRGHDHAHNAEASASADPTRTKTIRRQYAQNLRGELGRLNAAIRDGVQSRDIFGLSRNVQDSPVFRFERDDRKVEAFMQWLRSQIDRGLLEIIDYQHNTYIRSAYSKGLDHATAELQASGVQVSDVQASALINTGVHREALEMLFTRNFENLQGITNEMSMQMSRELADGFAQGLNPTEIARNLTDTVDTIGKRRATVLARTEVIRAHSEATLTRFENQGIEEVTTKAELLTAGDNRVCPICAALEGRTFTIQEAREETWEFDPPEGVPDSLGGEHALRPPIHPQCRCSLVPVV